MLHLVAIKGSCLSRKLSENKELHFEEVKSRDKGPMFVLLLKTRTVHRSISNNLKEHHHQTKLKTRMALKIFLVLFFLCYLIILL